MLPTTCDRSKTYYKITNEKECHYGLQYHTGLIIDPKPFDSDPTHSCVEGGIYFTTKEYLHRFFSYGCWIRPVKVPEDAKVIRDSSGNKYRADKLIFLERKEFEFYFDNIFDKEIFPRKDYYYLAMHCQEHLDKWFDKETFPRENYRYMAEYCSKHFDKWFDKEIFPRKDYYYLAMHCSEHFDKWASK